MRPMSVSTVSARLLRAVLLLLLGASLGPPAALGLAAIEPPPAPPAPSAARGMFSNPIGIHVADPSVIWHDGVYYLYGTSARDGFRVWTSPDLRDWTPRGHCFKRTAESWGRERFWAPEVIERHGRFYLFYSAAGPTGDDGRLSLRVCLAASDSPLGPFEDVAAPLWDPGYATIDAFPFVDADGAAYLYFVRDTSEQPTSDVYVARLSEDFRHVDAEATRCLTPSQPWEGGRWNEGPAVLAHERADGRTVYVMAYSANGYFDPAYAVGYATADGPVGPWTKAAENPILARRDTPAGPVSGPGHGSFLRRPGGAGELLYVYHVHRRPTGGGDREVAIDRARLVEGDDGGVRLTIAGPTRGAPQPFPAAPEPATASAGGA